MRATTTPQFDQKELVFQKICVPQSCILRISIKRLIKSHKMYFEESDGVVLYGTS